MNGLHGSRVAHDPMLVWVGCIVVTWGAGGKHRQSRKVPWTDRQLAPVWGGGKWIGLRGKWEGATLNGHESLGAGSQQLGMSLSLRTFWSSFIGPSPAESLLRPRTRGQAPCLHTTLLISQAWGTLGAVTLEKGGPQVGELFALSLGLRKQEVDVKLSM